MRNKCDMNMAMAYTLSQDADRQEGWTTSVHCSYYAVFQYMKYLLAEKATSPISYSSQDARTGEDSHKYILQEIQNRITSSTTARNIGERIKKLRHDRVLADYRTHVFSQADSLDCFSEADAIIRKLKTLMSA